VQCGRHARRALASGLLAACALGALTACGSVRSHPMAGAEYWGFTAPWDPRSTASVAAHGSQLDAVVSGFVILDSASLRPVTPFGDTLVVRNAGNRRYMAMLTSYQGSRFHPETIRALAADSAVLAKIAGETATLLGGAGYRGLVLDFEGLTANDLDALLRVAGGIADSARAHGVSPVGIAIPATDTAGYPARPLLGAADFLIVMLYDEHWSTSPPGPIAAPTWTARALGTRVGDVGASRVIAAFPVYGYQWRSDSATAVLSYADAQRLAQGVHTPLVRDPASATLHVEGPTWSAWVSDAVLLDSLVRGARRTGVTRFALWRLGLEDPRVWTDVVR
jgi:spore germination protein YaaH